MPGLTVIICTYNGLPRLRPTLAAVAKCHADFPVEIIVVDNNSNDGTAEAARRFWAELGNAAFAFRVVHESRPGTSYARRRGVLEAHGEVIVFCDDDNWLDPDYLMTAMEVMEDPTVGAVGGAGQPVFERGNAPPPHFYNVATWLACGAQFGAAENVAQEVVDLTPLHHVSLFGAGLVVRRADMMTMVELPDFPVLPCRTGSMLSSGGDYEICHLVALSGKKLIYNSNLRFSHFMPEARLEASYLKRLGTSRDDWRTLGAYAVARKLRFSKGGMWDLLRSAVRALFRGSHLDAFRLAVRFDRAWLAHRDDRATFRNVRAVLKKSSGVQ